MKTATNRVQDMARRTGSHAEQVYQLVVCGGLALMAGFAGTAGALLLHGM